MELHAVYASDDNYAPYMGISVYSLLYNNSKCFEKIHLYVLDNGIGNENRKRLIKQVSFYPNAVITFHSISQKINEISPKYNNGWPTSIYGRYFISDITDLKADKLLYLDCDTIVNGSLSELIALDISDYLAAGVVDCFAYKQKEYLGLDKNALYLNSGVLLINLDKWKRENVQSKLVQYTNSFDKKLIYPDQDSFNAVCCKSLLRLPLKYNFFHTMSLDYVDTYLKKSDTPYSRDEIIEAMSDNYAKTVVFHFTGMKPWNKSESSPSFEKIFSSYARRSCWSYIKPKFRSISSAVSYYRMNFTIGLYDLTRRIVGDKFYNYVKEKYKHTED